MPQIATGAAMIAVSAIVAAILLLTKNEGLSLAVLAGGAFCAFLTAAPPFWLALLLVALIPFHGLIAQLLGGFESSSRQWFVLWKELLLGVGALRVIWRSPNRRAIIVANRGVLIPGSFLMFVYCAAFLRAPSIPGIFSIDLELKFLGILVFFMFLDLDAKSIARLLHVMVWSVGLVAAYGLVQYAWDYDRLLPLVFHSPDLFTETSRRLYSYSLTPLDPAFGVVIASLILFTGAGGLELRAAAAWFALLAPCLLFTYTRSAYLGLVAGIATVCIADRGRLRRYAAIVGVSVSLIAAVLLFGGAPVRNSNIGQRFQSIFLQTDESSAVHKERMSRAIEVIARNPFGIGLGEYGTVQARFAGGSDEADWAEDAVLQVTVETGLIGGFAYLAFMAAVLISLLRPRHRRREDERLLAVCAGAVFAAMTLIGMVLPVWDEFFPLFYAWALAGLALASGCKGGPREIPAGAGPHFV